MNRSIKDFVKICSETLPVKSPVYEFGSRQMPGQEGYSNIRPFFDGIEFVGADYIAGPGVDIVLDLHHIDLPDNSVTTLVCMEVLEHVQFPFDALKEIYRVIKPGGMLIISVPMKLNIHGSPYDYWRYTPDGVKTLLLPFSQAFVGFCGDNDFPDNVVAIAIKDDKIDLKSFEDAYTMWQKRWTPTSLKYIKIFKKYISFILPALFTGSTFELWRRQCSNPDYNITRGFFRMLMPPFFKQIIKLIR